MGDVTTIGKANFRNSDRTFGIRPDDRRRHFYVLGKTGMGKSTLLENMTIDDIRAGRGVAVVDPHGEYAEMMLDFIPPERKKDVIYFNPADTAFPMAFNVMEQVDPDKRHLIASGLIGVFKKIWAESWGPRLEYLLRNTILSLLDYPDATLLGIMKMFVDKPYRNKVVAQVKDPVLKSFWIDEYSKYNQQFAVEAVAPIQNKVGQFLSASLIRNIVGQPKSAIDVRDVMDNKKILIMNLSKGRIGEDNSALLGAMMITKIQLAAMSRVDMNESERNDFYLYVDEFQNFATESFANILSEARKYRLNLILAHQYINQLVTTSGNSTVRDAVFGNVGTLVCFRVGADDAEFLEKEFGPNFTMNDLVNLAKYNIYLKLMIDGVTSEPFSALTLPPYEKPSPSHAQEVIELSRENYGTPRAQVEKQIAEWSGFSDEILNGTATQTAPAQSVQKQAQKAIADDARSAVTVANVVQKNVVQKNNAANESEQEKEDRTMHFTECWTCKQPMKVPFKPDGKRPVLCKDCFREASVLKEEGKIPNVMVYPDYKKALESGELTEREQEAPEIKESDEGYVSLKDFKIDTKTKPKAKPQTEGLRDVLADVMKQRQSQESRQESKQESSIKKPATKASQTPSTSSQPKQLKPGEKINLK